MFDKHLRLFTIIIFKTVFIDIGCKQSWETNHPELISKSLHIPDSIAPFNEHAKNVEIDRNRFYLIAVLDADCYTCVGELERWTNFLEKNNEFSQLNTLFIAVGEYNFYFEKSLLKKDFIKVPVFIDFDSIFIKRNDLFGIKQNDTIVLDSNLVIKYVGTPISNSINKKIF